MFCNVSKGTGNGYASCTSTDCVPEFADLFKSDYETLKSAGGLDGSKITDLDDYLDNIEKMGEFDHKMDQPFKSFISGLLDVTIIKPIIECGLGYDLITREDLTGFERAMKGVFALVDIVTLGTAVVGTEGIEFGGKETLILAGETFAVDTGANATSYTVGYISDTKGAPPVVTVLLSLVAGVTVSEVAGKYFFKSASGALLGDCDVLGESLDGLKEISKAGLHQSKIDVTIIKPIIECCTGYDLEPAWF